MTCLKKILATESFTQNLLNHADDLDYKCHQKIEVEKKIETNVNTIVESNKILRITTAFVDLKPKKLLCTANHIHVYLKKIYLLGRKY